MFLVKGEALDVAVETYADGIPLDDVEAHLWRMGGKPTGQPPQLGDDPTIRSCHQGHDT